MPRRYSLNTATIMPAPLLTKIDAAHKAGYHAIELWIFDIEKWVKEGKPLADLRKRLDDANLDRPSMIAVWGWTDPDAGKRANALNTAQKTLEYAAELGIKRVVASPPKEKVNFDAATDHYAKLLERAEAVGVPVSVEFLGFVDGINTLEGAWKIAGGTGNPKATVTPDTFHMFRGGSKTEFILSVPADHISIFHWNDVPAQPARTQQQDKHRVLPGDGVLDLPAFVKALDKIKYQGYFSLELFNQDLWKQDPHAVVREGLAKMKRTLEQGPG